MSEEMAVKKSKTKLNIRIMTLVGLMVAVCGICAQIAIPLPFSPVPLTLQTLAIMVAAMMLGPRWGTLVMLVYVAAGSVGIPVFAQAKAGIGALAGATGGFIWGFIPGAFVMGLLAGETQKDLKFSKALVSALAGLAIIYCCGVIQLSLVAGLSIGQAILVGVLPYLPLEAVKILLAAKIVSSVRRRGVLNI
ncbi:MAG: biotin transporter BioY [Clostridia bacterium]|nr:biotin transporter BioY [Clostridia bacterium]